jgi:Ca2+-binding RTX toxin-like protein
MTRRTNKSNESNTMTRRAAACVFEAMETRQMMSANLSNGTLTINGTAGNDTISIVRENNNLKINDNGQTRTFNRDAVQRINVNLGAGNDNFSADKAVAAPMNISGGVGNDTLSGGSGDDTVRGEEGNDLLFAHDAGADIHSGGLGTDEVSYAGAVSRVNVSLDNVANDGLTFGAQWWVSVENDNVSTDVENVTGSAFDDFLLAYSAPGVGHVLKGMAGNDYLTGGDQADQLFGYYGNDTLVGNGGNDSIWGEAGADLLNGGLGYDDLRYDDTFNQRTSGVTVVLPRSWEVGYRPGQGSAGENDRIAGFEAVWGTRFNDKMWGNDLDNHLFGMEGNDLIAGEEGNDRLFGFHGNDSIYGGRGNDWVFGENGTDSLSGGEGWDDVRYDEAGRTTGVSARLANSWEPSSRFNGSYGENDTFASDFEALIGSRFNDVLSGNSFNNYMAGLDGDDLLLGYNGDDTLDLGNGADRGYGGDGNDTIFAKDGAYSDYVDGGAGWDTANRDRSFIVISIFGTPRRDNVVGCEVVNN